MRTIQLLVKHVFDFIFALMLGVIAFPIIIVTIIVIKVVSPEDPAVFRQQRIGYRNQPFTIYKLRTMTNERDENGILLPDEARTRKWGKIIRSANIDELTQILNILKFQMSWIGPRPLLPKEMKVMSEEQQRIRQSMLPGISGWEAVNEGKTQTRPEMAQYDLFYVENWSLWFDVKIFVQTIWIVLLRLRPNDALRAPKMPDSTTAEKAEIAEKDCIGTGNR